MMKQLRPNVQLAACWYTWILFFHKWSALWCIFQSLGEFLLARLLGSTGSHRMLTSSIVHIKLDRKCHLNVKLLKRLSASCGRQVPTCKWSKWRKKSPQTFRFYCCCSMLDLDSVCMNVCVCVCCMCCSASLRGKNTKWWPLVQTQLVVEINKYFLKICPIIVQQTLCSRLFGANTAYYSYSSLFSC